MIPAGSGEKPSSWVTMLTALTCESMPWSIVARRPAAKIATSTTSATPIISAEAVTAVRWGWRRVFSRASMPVRPWKRASGRPIRPLSGRTSVGASSANPKIISRLPSAEHGGGRVRGARVAEQAVEQQRDADRLDDQRRRRSAAGACGRRRA